VKEKSLSLEAILAATTAYVDRHGLESLTMRALATEMGVYPTAIYWYVGSKSRLTSLAAGQLVGDLRLARAEDETWQDWLVSTAQAMRAAIHRHPNFATVIGSQISADISSSTPFVEALLGVLYSAGFDDDEVVDVYNVFVGAVFGWVSIELSNEPPSVGGDEHWQQNFKDHVDSLSAVKYPNITRTIPHLANRAFMVRWESGKTNPLESSFVALVSTIVAGLEARLAAHHS
jgi:TetR/AcrR family tetracycline transcriptional repressor